MLSVTSAGLRYEHAVGEQTKTHPQSFAIYLIDVRDVFQKQSEVPERPCLINNTES